MALIDCKECGNKVSDKAQACPKCGAPVELDQPEEKNEGEPKKKSKVGLFCGIGVLIVAIIVALFLLVPDLRFWEDTKRSSRSHSDDSDDIENCERDSIERRVPAVKRDYVERMARQDSVAKAEALKEQIKQEREENLSGIYVGNVGKSEVQMTLSQSNNYVSGSYIYTNVGNELTLTGYFNGEEITLSETTPKGNYSATWTLYPTSNGLEGSMYVYHTQKTHNVTLTRID